MAEKILKSASSKVWLPLPIWWWILKAGTCNTDQNPEVISAKQSNSIQRIQGHFTLKDKRNFILLRNMVGASRRQKNYYKRPCKCLSSSSLLQSFTQHGEKLRLTIFYPNVIDEYFHEHIFLLKDLCHISRGLCAIQKTSIWILKILENSLARRRASP